MYMTSLARLKCCIPEVPFVSKLVEIARHVTPCIIVKMADRQKVEHKFSTIVRGNLHLFLAVIILRLI